MMIGKKLKGLRKSLGLTQEEMAAGIMSKSFYSKIENGKSEIKIVDLLSILEKQKISLNDFFGDLKFKNVEIELIQAFNNFDTKKLHKLIESNELKGDLLEQAKIMNLIFEGKTATVSATYKEKIRLEFLKVGSLDAYHINKLRFAIPFISSDEAKKVMDLIMSNTNNLIK